MFNHCAHANNCWQAFKDSASMATDWALGNGAEMRVFGPGSTQVTDMMDAPGVNGARDLLYKTNATSVTNYKASFGLIDFLTTSSPTQQFVGSYRVDIFTVNQGADLMFVLNNNSSFQSFGYGVTPAWDRSKFKPGGNMHQVYWWTEPRK